MTTERTEGEDKRVNCLKCEEKIFTIFYVYVCRIYTFYINKRRFKCNLLKS